MEQTGLPVPNVVQGAPAKAAPVSAKSGMSLQELQLHRTAHLAQPTPARWPAADISTDPPSWSFLCNAEAGSFASINCIVEQEQRNARATVRWTAS
ncbi:hypothetical protein MTO96_005000 [Rhipicephalus appendiculatus]